MDKTRTLLMKWKDFLYFRRGSKVAVILLMILILLTLILNMLLSYRNSSTIVVLQNDSIVYAFDEFLQALKKDDSIVYPEEKKVNRTNTKHISNIFSDKKNIDTSQNTIYYSRYPRAEKLMEGETISINSSDTSEWKKIPGIGSVYASRIVEYRNLLGGFVRKEQLMEVYRLDSELYARISPYIEVDGSCIKMQINNLEFKEILRHPYMNYKQVVAIMNLRRKKGNVSSISELSMLDEFTKEDIFRLEPYLEF